MISATRDQRRQLARDNAKMPTVLRSVPLGIDKPESLVAAWRSRDFLVQGFIDNGCLIRLSINRTTLGQNGRWLENITWDELQELKRQAGYGNHYAIEVYPKTSDVVNVANMRHLWVLESPLNIGWINS